MFLRFPMIVCACIVGLSLPVHAQDRACLLEGSFAFAGQKLDIKDCLENNGVPKARFQETCKSLAEATVGMGLPAAKNTPMAACPAQPQGACEGLFGAKMTAYYYKRDAQSLADTKTSCAAQGGKWKAK